ncbi:uncharacterized protein NEMAJ01_0606 [Nematocida major]|uniref:uncharacterized protein n=1 Tax=Nematocida major TaxID=1912982 RepID=UPI002007F178|nr:uncharacterized protein NEMAJ01_0606 [Nematocida major]KAH9385710.1 hypothetical protein NEMAJ01_0606 [Nematocida major]
MIAENEFAARAFSGESRESEGKSERRERHASEKAPRRVLLKFRNYTRKTGKKTILLHNVTFDVPRGKLIALMGLSGEGKTTLFESISGRCSPGHTTYGSVEVAQKSGWMDSRHAEEWVPRVNYHKQEVTKYRKIPVYTLLCSVARCYGADVGRIDKLLAYFRVSKTRHTAFANLSGGEQKRVMTIIGVLAEKELNLWDEPLTGLDSEIAKKTLRFMKQEMRTTSIVSIHQPSSQLMSMFEWVIFMHSSTVIYSGPYKGMEEYFRRRGISYTEDILFIDYMMRLSAENAETQEDVENIHVLERLTLEITGKPLAEKRAGNVFLSNSFGVSSTRVFEVLSRSFYFNSGFFGSSILYEAAYYSGMLLILKIICVVFDKIILGPEPSAIIGLFLQPILAFLNIRTQISEGDPDADVFASCFDVASSSKWLSCVVGFFQNERPFIFVSMLSLFSNLTGIDYFRLCTTNIAEGQFTVGDFLAASFIEVFARKLPTSFLFSVFSYCIAYTAVRAGDLGVSVPGSTFDFLFVCFVSSFLLCMYVVAIHFLPIPPKLFMYAGLGVVLFMQSLVYQMASLGALMESKMAKLIGGVLNGVVDLADLSKPKPKNRENPLYEQRLNMLQEKMFFLDSRLASASDSEKSTLKHLCMKASSELLKLLYRAGPFGITEELLTKLRLYRETLYSVEGSADLAHRLQQETPVLLYSGGAVEKFQYETALSYIENMERPFQMHEMFLPDVHVDTVHFSQIVGCILRGLLLPTALLLLFGLMKYKQMQPQIRS